MSHIEFVYYDTVYNESVFTHTYDGPFVDKMEFELVNTQVPCDEEYAHVTRVGYQWSLVLQKVPSEANPKVRNHGEGPY